ncbi:MAG: heat-inducible transcriptional repressor HrcA [Oscillospiraceae bacterium]
MKLSDRKKKILAAIIENYIDSAEPVGSKAIARSSGLGLSSATIRNEMAELTAMGYLEQPHTSAGRIPSPKGYRLYVNELMRRHRLSLEEMQAINYSLSQKVHQLDMLMGNIGRLASQLTNYPALALAPPTPATIQRFDMIYINANTFIIVALLSNNTVKNKLVHLPFSVEQGMVQKLSTLFNVNLTGITEDKITNMLINTLERASGDTMGLVSVIAGFAIEVLHRSQAGQAVVTGTPNLLRLPEFRDPEKAHRVMSYLSDINHLLELTELDNENDIPDNDIKVYIGPENVAEELQDSSVVLAGYNAGDNMQGLIGVVGPTRMDYSRVAAKLSYIAEGLSRLLASGEAPQGFDKIMIKGDDIDE